MIYKKNVSYTQEPNLYKNTAIEAITLLKKKKTVAHVRFNLFALVGFKRTEHGVITARFFKNVSFY